MEFILANKNWFYLYGIVYIISTVYDIIKRSRDKPKKKIDISFDVKNFDREKFNELREEIKKDTSVLSNIISYSIFAWIIFGFWQVETYLFIFLAVLVFVIPFLSTLSDSTKAMREFQQSGNPVISSEVIDTKKYKKFFSFLGLVEIFIITIILVNHFKIAIFYALQ